MHTNYPSIFLSVLLALVVALTGWPVYSPPTPVLAQASNPAPLPNITQISLGDNHTCALTTSGGVKCWGANDYGQLGDGTTSSKATPGIVSGLSSGVTAITAGGNHTCALTTGGGVKCWGRGSSGEVGDGTWSTHATPVDVSGLTSGVKAISAGGYHTCALTTSGGVKCWGDNLYGQIGANGGGGANTPVDVTGLGSSVTALTAGGSFNCVLTTGGGAKCWGDNGWGQLGTGSNNSQNIPVDVSGLTSGVSAISAGGHHACALLSGGGVKCWGFNNQGQVGSGSMGGATSTPIAVSGLTSGVSALTTGALHTCALLSGGGVKCWGFNNQGQVGDDTVVDKNTPTAVSGLSSSELAIGAGGAHTCAVTTAGNVKCWGANTYGQLGDGTLGNKNTPSNVSGLAAGGVKTISTGGAHTCVVTTTGGVKCWGDGVEQPGDVSGLASGVALVAAGGAHTCVLTTTNGVKCWGNGYSGQLGNGANTDQATPVDVSGLASGIKAITTGQYHSCALTTAGGVKCWGADYNGQLGDGTSGDKNTPVDVSGLTSGVQAISAGSMHTCALLTTGGVKCWGQNWNGQLGDGTSTNQTTPVNVSGLTSGVTAISAGGKHTCALTTTGGVKCWGNSGANFTEQPTDVSGLASGVIALSAGALYTCALTTAGGVKCWGQNSLGQLGDGTNDQKNTPVDVSGLTGGVSMISAGDYHTCAVTTTGAAKCWGDNAQGQLGDNSAWRTTPVDVVENTVSLQPNRQLTQQPGYTQTCATATTPYAKTCTLRFTLKNTSGGMLQIRYYRITTVSSHVDVLNGAPNPGHSGAIITDVRSVAPNATFQPTFNLGLKTSTPYTLRFAVYGYAGNVVAAGADDAPADELGDFEATVTPSETDRGGFNSFLPVVQR